MRGVPLRLEIGPKDIEKSQVVLARRDTREKSFVPMDGLAAHVEQLLATIQQALFDRARGVPRRSTRRETDSLRRVQADHGRAARLRRLALVRVGGVRGRRSRPRRRRRSATSRLRRRRRSARSASSAAGTPWPQHGSRKATEVAARSSRSRWPRRRRVSAASGPLKVTTIQTGKSLNSDNSVGGHTHAFQSAGHDVRGRAHRGPRRGNAHRAVDLRRPAGQRGLAQGVLRAIPRPPSSTSRTPAGFRRATTPSKSSSTASRSRRATCASRKRSRAGPFGPASALHEPRKTCAQLLDDRAASAEPRAPHDGGRRGFELMAPGQILRRRRPRPRQRLEAAGIADGRGRRHERLRERARRGFERLPDVVQRHEALTPGERLMGLAARLQPFRPQARRGFGVLALSRVVSTSACSVESVALPP